MTESPLSGRPPLSRQRLALIALALAMVALAIWLLRDTLTFETQRENRETLLAWRDANFLAAAAGYMLLYVLVIALSVPGGAVMTLTGGFLFGLVAGTAMTVVAATTGATLIFLAAKAGFGPRQPVDSLWAAAGSCRSCPRWSQQGESGVAYPASGPSSRPQIFASTR